MDPMDEIKQTFFLECADLLDELEEGLIALNDGEGDKETVNAVFRAVHSIKGGAGAFGLDTLVRFAHTFETVLDEIRSDKLEATPDVMALMLRSGDILSDLVAAARDNNEADEVLATQVIDELLEIGGTSVDAPEEEIDFEPMAIDFDLGDDSADVDLDATVPVPAAKTFSIQFAPKASLYSNANESSLLLRDLRALGD